MRRTFLTVLTVLATAPSSSHASSSADSTGSYFVPPAAVIERLGQRSPKERWYVSTPGVRYLIRQRTIEGGSLSGLGPGGDEPVPDRISWTEIERIDLRTTRRGTGTVLGAAAGALVLGFAGAAIGEAMSTDQQSHNDAGAWTGIAVGTLGGGWLGAHLGGKWQGTDELYVGAPTNLPRSGAVAELRPDEFERVRTHRGEPMRIEGSFGFFEGRVESVTKEGLAGLRPATTPAPAEPISWSQVTRIERHGGFASRGAWIGAISLGVVAGALGAATAIGFGGDDADAWGGLAVGALGGVIVGAPIGAAIGSTVHGWQEIYRSPALASRAP